MDCKYNGKVGAFRNGSRRHKLSHQKQQCSCDQKAISSNATGIADPPFHIKMDAESRGIYSRLSLQTVVSSSWFCGLTGAESM